jgi:hypothetical protein
MVWTAILSNLPLTNIPNTVQVQHRVWPTNYFKAAAAPKREDYPSDLVFRQVVYDRSRVEELFNNRMEEHVRDAAAVTGMTYLMLNGNRVIAEDTNGIFKSLKGDASLENIKRACFIFHYSTDNPYFQLYHQSMFTYAEEKIMQILKVQYPAHTKQDGCIAKLGAKSFNTLTSNLKKRANKQLGITFNLKLPRDAPDQPPPPKNRNKFSYYIGSLCTPMDLVRQFFPFVQSLSSAY